MTAIHETAYPRIKPHLSIKEFKEVFTPNEKEIALMDANTKSSNHISRLGFMMLLKCYQYLGRPIKVNKIPVTIKKHIALALQCDINIDLVEYHKDNRKRHVKIIRDYLQINTDKKERYKIIKTVARRHCLLYARYPCM